jgi:hypothetical protein
MKAPVKRRALEARLRRHLEKKEVKVLYKSRGQRMKTEYGMYYAVDQTNQICEAFDDLEEFCRDRGVLREWESLEE